MPVATGKVVAVHSFTGGSQGIVVQSLAGLDSYQVVGSPFSFNSVERAAVTGTNLDAKVMAEGD